MREPMDYSEYVTEIREECKYAMENYGWHDTQCLAWAYGDLRGQWENRPEERVLALVAVGKCAIDMGLLHQYHPSSLFNSWRELIESDQVSLATEGISQDQKTEFMLDASRLADGIRQVLGDLRP